MFIASVLRYMHSFPPKVVQYQRSEFKRAYTAVQCQKNYKYIIYIMCVCVRASVQIIAMKYCFQIMVCQSLSLQKISHKMKKSRQSKSSMQTLFII